MSDAFRCSRCGSTMAPGATTGAFCPACLLRAGLDDEISSPATDSIGPYRIVETIGEGGMGVVYLAEQDHPIRRAVALKVIKLGMDTREVVARFNSEREALALMDHPCIARVLDAGASADGRPYFVMEYVPGLAITEFCDRHALPTDARLRLMRQVCAAVQHAHQRGIIHRDLKPSNVLVATGDGEPLPKIIDFGVAKAVEHDVLVHTVFTEQGRLVGTPEYMSPEQASLGAAPIDTQTDIYSLGVLLYELLVGALPFEASALRAAGYDEMRRVIREVEAPKPSTRLPAAGARATQVADCRSTRPDALRRKLQGDLDWITLKALEKDPARRYASASELAADILRHLRREPVTAGPPGAAYRASTFVRRHRLGVAAAAAFALLLVAASAVSLTLFARAESARRDAERRAYRANIVAADLSVAAGEVREARRLLDLAPPHLRGWEWGYLRHRVDASVAVLTAAAAPGERGRVPAFTALTVVGDRLVATARADASSNRDALLQFDIGGAPLRVPPAGRFFVDDDASVLAVSADGRRLLVSRWFGDAPTARLLPPAAASASGRSVELRLDNVALGDRNRNLAFVVDAQSGRTIAALTLDLAGVWRGDQRDPRTIRVGSASAASWQRAEIVDDTARRIVATVPFPGVIRGVLNGDGTQAAIWSWDNVIHVWDVERSREMASLGGHSDFIAHAVFAPAGGRLFSASYDGTIRIWDLPSGRIAVLGPLPAPVTAMAVARAGDVIAAGLNNGIVRLWRAGTLVPAALGSGLPGPGPPRAITSLTFDRDERRLVGTSMDRSVRVWDTAALLEVLTLNGHEDAVTGAALSADGRFIVSSSLDGTIRLWDVQSPLEAVSEKGRQARGMAFVDDDAALATGHGDDVVRVWDLRTGAVIRRATLPGELASLAADDGGRLAVGLVNRATRNRPPPNIAAMVMDSRSLRTLATLTGQPGVVSGIALNDEGTRLATVSDGGVWLWDVPGAREIRRWAGGADSRAVSLARTFDATATSSDGHGHGLLIWPVRDEGARPPRLLPMLEPPAATLAVAFRTDTRRVVSGGRDGLVRIWDAGTGRVIAALNAHDAAVHAVAVSPDDRRIASGGADRTVRIWDADTHELLLTLRGAAPVHSVAFSRSGRRLAAGALDGTVRIWSSTPTPDSAR